MNIKNSVLDVIENELVDLRLTLSHAIEDLMKVDNENARLNIVSLSRKIMALEIELTHWIGK